MVSRGARNEDLEAEQQPHSPPAPPPQCTDRPAHIIEAHGDKLADQRGRQRISNAVLLKITESVAELAEVIGLGPGRHLLYQQPKAAPMRDGMQILWAGSRREYARDQDRRARRLALRTQRGRC
jgi:hypothetical protein